MLSAKSLADPRAKRALAKLATFSDDERVVQLCNIEAMAQIAAWDESFRPDGLVAYARAAERIAGNRVSAGGAAFRSLGRWYGLSYGCDLSPDHRRVIAFQFQVGKPIPEKQWNDLALPSGDALD